MADTVKKSRIVSDSECCENLPEESSLQDIINEEFNQRLKNCMKDDEIEASPEHVALTYELGETVLKNGHTKNANDLMETQSLTSDVSEDSNVLNRSNEISSNGLSTNNETEDESWSQNGNSDKPICELESPDAADSFVNDENLGPETCQEEPFPSSKERFLSTVTDFDEDEENKCSASAKDRMFLSTDSACLLFTQTVLQSPMLTPTDENYDFLQGVTQNNTTPEENPVVTEPVNSPVENKEIILEESDKLLIESQDELIDGINTAVIDESLERIEKIDNIKDITLQFLQNEIMELDKEIVEHFVPQIENAELDLEQEVSNVDFNSEIILVEETVEPLEEKNEEVVLDTPVEEHNGPKDEETAVIETEEIVENELTSPTKVSEISKKFSGEEEDTLQVAPRPISPNLSGTYEPVQKTKEMFEKKASSETHFPKSCNLVKHLEDGPKKPEDECDSNNSVCSNLIVSSKTTSESTIIETATESKNNQDKSPLKKKKSKKTKKEHEKENISVCDFNNTNEEECLSHVSVRNLCRSFSDLTSIESKHASSFKAQRISYGRTKSMTDITTSKEPVSTEICLSGVSVKALRDSYSKLINNITNSRFDQGVKPLRSPVIPTSPIVSSKIERLKSSFSKFDALTKKTVLHVRSTEASKAQDKFNGSAPGDTSNCKSCTKPVFQMEQIKAEKSIWHKNCFRCQECNKQLTVDTYQSNEGVLYCKPHFKALFTPKAVEETNQPTSDKPDLGLEELQNLNVKERFQVFEHHDDIENNLERTPSAVNVKRSPSILSKLAKFQSKGMNIGVEDESLNGIPVEESSSESEPEEEDDGITGEDADLIRAKRAQREKPLHFNNMSDIMSKWESGNQMSKEERREERKQEIQSIRSRLFMGKQGKMKELYQQAVMDSESGAHVKKQVATEVCENAKLIKEKFERGEALTHDEEQKLKENDDMSVFDNGISKKSRSIFLELDANASKPPQLSPVSPVRSTSDVRKVREAFMGRQVSEDVVRSSDQVDDVTIQTADITNRFKFFEAYKEPEKKRKQFRITPPREGQVKSGSPDREIYRDPEVIRSEEQLDDSEVIQKSHTTSKMLSIFRQMEENINKDPQPAGPKPLKRFTPPPEPTRGDDSSSEVDDSETEEESEESEHEDLNKLQDEDLLEAQKAARAKQLRAKFERWEATEIQREQNNSSVNIAEELGQDQSQIESAKSLRARFESMRGTTTEKVERAPRVKVNRFVDTTNNTEICRSCEGRVYPLEKITFHNNVYHKNCFRCRECNTILRMDSFAYNQGLLYCTPHFKRLFIAKGNYESGFGLGQHKEKWNVVS